MNILFLLLTILGPLVSGNNISLNNQIAKIFPQTQPNSQKNVLAAVAQDEFIIPAPSAEDDQETYIPPIDVQAAQVQSDANIASDVKILDTQPVNVASVTKPNIVFLLLDDVAYIDDRVWERLPTIKKLFIDQGARFTNFQGETPLCCPGRAGYLTGQHTFNHKVITNFASLFNPSMTMATQLHKAGYYTFLSGKYLNGFNGKHQKTPGWDNFAGYGGAYQNFWLWINGKHVFYPTQYSSEVIKNKALTYLRKAPVNKPLFAYISPFAVHASKITFPHSQPDPKYIGDPRCQNIPRWNPPNYNEADMSDKPNYNKNRGEMAVDGWDLTSECETLLSVEDIVSKVNTELTNQNRINNTVFVLGADNGMMWGAHRGYGKVWPYATQVNFFVHWPDGIGTNPFTISEAVQNIDVASTFCEIGGCKMGPYPNGQKNPDGKSFLSLLKGKTNSMGRDVILEDYLISGSGSMPTYYALMTTPQNSLGQWHYVEYADGEKELYDISNRPCITWKEGDQGDPCELNNLLTKNAPALTNSALIPYLKKAIYNLKHEKGSPITTPIPTFIPSPTDTPAPTTIPLVGYSTANIVTGADSYVRSDIPVSNFGGSTTIRADKSPIAFSYLKFDLSSLANKTVAKAVLRLKVGSSSDAGSALGQGMNVNLVSNTFWGESTITYNNKPASAQTISTVTGAKKAGQTFEVDVTNIVSQKVGGKISFQLQNLGPDGIILNTKEAVSGKPTLVVTYR